MVHNFDPIFIDFGIIQIRWYSLAYILGILIGWWYGKKLIKIQIEGNKQIDYLKNFDDLIGYIIIGIIVGGRLGYILFYNFSFYIANPFEIFKVWNGGMSFHGGLLGVIITTYIFSNIKNLNFKIYFDTISCVAPIGIFLGRIANFINSELYGKETDLFWSVKFEKVDNIFRHPSQIYEAFFEGIILFIILNFIFKKQLYKSPGFISALFLIFYSIFRFFIEFTREPDVQIGYILFNLSLGQLLSFLFFMFGIFLFYKKK